MRRWMLCADEVNMIVLPPLHKSSQPVGVWATSSMPNGTGAFLFFYWSKKQK